MAKMKNEINFIESQKLVAKQNQSTSFEFILVISVIVLITVMFGLYMIGYNNISTLETEIKTLEGTLEQVEEENAINKLAFDRFETTIDDNGNAIITGYDDKGNPIYVWRSVEEVNADITNKLNAALQAKEELKAQIDLTSTIIRIVYAEANALNCKITSFSYSSNSVSLTLTSPTNEEWGKYKDALGKKIDTASLLNNSLYISNVQSNATSSSNGIYTFRVTFNVISDTLYLVQNEQ